MGALVTREAGKVTRTVSVGTVARERQSTLPDGADISMHQSAFSQAELVLATIAFKLPAHLSGSAYRAL